jgi:NADH-quinone oxidoreductase subunit A
MDAASNATLWALLVYALVTAGLFGGVLVLSRYLGPLKRRTAPEEPYESGVVPTGSAQIRFNVQFYLIAVIFIVFDLETMFIVAWAVVFREVGLAGYLEIAVFIVVLVATLIYLGRTGALDVTRRRDAALRRDQGPEAGTVTAPAEQHR